MTRIHGRYHNIRDINGVIHHDYDTLTPTEPEHRVTVKAPVPSWQLDDVEIDLQARIDAMFAPEEMP